MGLFEALKIHQQQRRFSSENEVPAEKLSELQSQFKKNMAAELNTFYTEFITFLN